MSGPIPARLRASVKAGCLGVAASLLAFAGSSTEAAGPAKWVTLAKSGNGDLLQADGATVQRSGAQRAVWFRLVKERQDAKRVKTSTSLVWLDCAKRRYNLMVRQDVDARGQPVAQRSFGNRGKGFEPIARGTAVDTVARAVCGG